MLDPDTGRNDRPPWATAIAPAYDKFLPDDRNKGKFVVGFEDGSFTAYTMDEASARNLLETWMRPDDDEAPGHRS